jgi:hypothetical protein
MALGEKMTKRSKIYGWLPADLFKTANPLHAVIVGVVDNEDDTLLRVSIDKTIYQMSLWGNNQNFLVDKFGDDDDKWLGKQISISRVLDAVSGKNKTIFS